MLLIKQFRRGCMTRGKCIIPGPCYFGAEKDAFR